MIRKISYAVVLLSCLVAIGLADFFIAGFDVSVFSNAAYWYSIVACAVANYIMLTYTAIDKIDNSIAKDDELRKKKSELEDTVNANVETDFDDYLSIENRNRKISAWKTKLSNKIAKLDEHTTDRDREILWYGSEEDKSKSRYCRKRQYLMKRLTDEYIEKNIAFLRVKYVKLRRYEVTHGCKQKYDEYRLTTKRNRKVALDNLPKIMQSMAFVIMASTFVFDYGTFTPIMIFKYCIKLGSLFFSIYSGIAYAVSFIRDTIIPDLQYRLNVIINYMTWKLKIAKKQGGND